MPDLYPEIEPFAQGMLEVTGGDLGYWEVCGNARGKPAVVLHGAAVVAGVELVEPRGDPAVLLRRVRRTSAAEAVLVVVVEVLVDVLVEV